MLMAASCSPGRSKIAADLSDKPKTETFAGLLSPGFNNQRMFTDFGPTPAKSELVGPLEGGETNSVDGSHIHDFTLGDTSSVYVCNLELLKAFGINKEDEHAFKSTVRERMYCTSNYVSCCRYTDLKNSKDYFNKGLEEFNKRVELIEETLLLFRGKAYQQLTKNIKDSSECHHIITDNKISLEDLEDDSSYLKQRQEEVEDLLVELETYRTNTQQFFGNFLCTVCNPENHPFFKLSDDGSEMDVHITTCSMMSTLRNFEIQLANFYNRFLYTMARAAECVQGTKDDKAKVMKLDMQRVKEYMKGMRSCRRSGFNPNDEECTKFCSESFFLYDFPAEIFGSIREVLRVVFKAILDDDIEEYYESIKDKQLDNGKLDEPVTFYDSQNETFIAKKISTIAWNYTATKGVTIFNDYMSNYFFTFASPN